MVHVVSGFVWFATLLNLGASASLAAEPVGNVSNNLYSLASTPDKVRWIEIHNLPTADADGVYHVEVMERRRADPVWKFSTLSKHMALTKPALIASIVKPVKCCAVYPETFDGGFEQWRKDREAGKATVCSTTIAQCLTEGLTMEEEQPSAGQ